MSVSERTMNALEQADELLARGRVKQAIDTLRASVRENPDNRRVLNRLGDLYVKSDQTDRAIAMFRRVGTEFEEDGLSAQAIALFKKVVRIDPEQWDAYERLGDLYTEQSLPFEAAAQYEIAARAYHKQEDAPAALRAWRGVVGQRPSDATARARLAEVCLATQRIPEALEEYRRIGEMMIAAGEAEQAMQVYSKVIESHFDPQFGRDAVEALKRSDQPGLAARLAVLVEKLATEKGVEVPAAESVRAPSPEAPFDEATFDVDATVEPTLAPVEVEPVEVEPVEVKPERQEAAEAVELVEEPEVDEALQEAVAARDDIPAAEAPGAELAAESTALGEVESVADEAAETFDAVEDEEEEGEEEVFEIDLSEFEELPAEPSEEVEEVVIPRDAGELGSELAELLDEVENDLAVGNEERALTRLTAVRTRAGSNARFRALWHQAKPMAPTRPAPAEPGHDLRGLGPEVEDSLMVAAATGADTESGSIEEIVAGFTQGLADALSADDFETHYNLGVGYREMGLTDEAISEFQIAAKSPDYLVESASMLGYVFRQRGLFDLAYEWYERARVSDAASEEQQLAMRYEQAETQYEAEEIEHAYQLFQEVYGVDSTFRDVAQRIDELRTG